MWYISATYCEPDSLLAAFPILGTKSTEFERKNCGGGLTVLEDWLPTGLHCDGDLGKSRHHSQN